MSSAWKETSPKIVFINSFLVGLFLNLFSIMYCTSQHYNFYKREIKAKWSGAMIGSIVNALILIITGLIFDYIPTGFIVCLIFVIPIAMIILAIQIWLENDYERKQEFNKQNKLKWDNRKVIDNLHYKIINKIPECLKILNDTKECQEYFKNNFKNVEFDSSLINLTTSKTFEKHTIYIIEFPQICEQWDIKYIAYIQSDERYYWFNITKYGSIHCMERDKTKYFYSKSYDDCINPNDINSVIEFLQYYKVT